MCVCVCACVCACVCVCVCVCVCASYVTSSEGEDGRWDGKVLATD